MGCFVETSNQPGDENSVILSSKKLKEKLREKYLSYGPMFMDYAEENVGRVDEGPSLAILSSLPGKGNVSGLPEWACRDENFDLVLAVKCEGWPLCAEEWITRSRCWPTQDIVNKVIKDGFHIVCKSSVEGTFRLSFSNAETILVGNLVGLQYKVYRAFKSFVNHYKHQWSPNIKKIVCSYHLKTIVLWYCEKTEPKDWTNDTVVSHLLSLIDDLINALKKRTLPMYFMPKYNLLEQMEDGNDVADRIIELRSRFDEISDGIISEEPDFESGLRLCAAEIVAIIELVQKCLKKGIFEPTDFMECFHRFWRGFGRFSSRNNVKDNRMVAKWEPLMKFLPYVSESINKMLFDSTDFDRDDLINLARGVSSKLLIELNKVRNEKMDVVALKNKH